MADAKGELQNVIVFVAEGLGDRSFDPPTAPAVIEQKGCMYQPHVLAMRANQPLDVVNDDPTAHNIHPTPANNREWNKAEPPGTKLEEEFTREEIAIPVKCNIHPWMHSYVAVFKHPYFAVTGQDGSFDLSNLPPGHLHHQGVAREAWHVDARRSPLARMKPRRSISCSRRCKGAKIMGKSHEALRSVFAVAVQRVGHDGIRFNLGAYLIDSMVSPSAICPVRSGSWAVRTCQMTLLNLDSRLRWRVEFISRSRGAYLCRAKAKLI